VRGEIRRSPAQGSITGASRFHAGRMRAGSPMPWEEFGTMNDRDVRALYQYLQTLPASPGGPDPKDRDSVAAPVAAR